MELGVKDEQSLTILFFYIIIITIRAISLYVQAYVPMQIHEQLEQKVNKIIFYCCTVSTSHTNLFLFLFLFIA